MGDVLCAKSLPQHISRSLIQHTTEPQLKPDRTGLIVIYRLPSLSEKEEQINTQSTWTHTHLSSSLFIPRLFRSVFVRCLVLLWFWLMLTWSCLFMTLCRTQLICTLFCSLSLAPSLGVSCFWTFSLLLVLDVVYITSHKYSHAHILLSLTCT